MSNPADLRIVFMGTPDFAVSSLEALHTAGFTIAGVVTAPDRPAGRGMQLQQSAVKKYALQQGWPILQPPKLKDPEFVAQLRSLRADVQVVVAFRMLPEVVWNMPLMGTVNVHGSLLPQYRGAAPINWAIINGETETGVTTFRLQHAIDTGNILLQASMPIGPNETAGEVHDRMKVLGAEVLVKTMLGLQQGNLPGQAQPEDVGQLKHAPKIFTETCALHFDTTAAEVHNRIRGLSPFPGAFFHHQQRMVKVYRSQVVAGKPQQPAGSVLTDGKSYLHVACTDGFVAIEELQLEGKKRMPVADFLRGNKL